MRITSLVLAATVVASGIGGAVAPTIAQAPTATTAPVEFTDNYGALFYYKTTQEAFDVAAAAAMSKDVQMASPFDKAKRQAAEEERIRKGLETVGGDRLLTTNVAASISPYDPTAREFTIDLFEPGRYVQFNAYNRAFQLVFENAEAYRSLKLPEAEARKVNDKSFPRSVTVKIDFHLSGAGDPTGSTASSNTVRAIATRVRIFDGAKQIAPDIVMANTPAMPSPATKAAGDWAVQGLHLGMTREAFEAAARSAYGSSAKFELGRDSSCGGPFSPVQGYTVAPGTVCVTYTADKASQVKQFTVKQILSDSPDANDGFRKLLVEKFGAVAYRDRSGEYGWGELVGPKAASNYTVYANAYAARTSPGMTSGTRGLPGLVITITDPEFARAQLPAAPASSASSPKL